MLLAALCIMALVCVIFLFSCAADLANVNGLGYVMFITALFLSGCTFILGKLV